MTYQQYIDLGFERIEIKDAVEFNRTGVHGFVLTKILEGGYGIEVAWDELDCPKLFRKGYICVLTQEQVTALCEELKKKDE
jgi:hypothetical protein